MSGIDPASQLVALMRAQIAGLRQRSGTRSARPAQPGATAASHDQDFAAVLAQRLQSIGATDPERDRKAIRIFLESVLLAELGAELANDPAFAGMVDQIQQRMQSDPQVAAAMREAAALLLRRRSG